MSVHSQGNLLVNTQLVVPKTRRKQSPHNPLPEGERMRIAEQVRQTHAETRAIRQETRQFLKNADAADDETQEGNNNGWAGTDSPDPRRDP